MTYVHRLADITAEDAVCYTDTPSGLQAIRQDHCAAAIWQRKPMDRFQKWIDDLPEDQLPRLRTILRPERVCDAVEDAAQFFGMPAVRERNQLIEDASALAMIFSDVMRASYIHLRLDVVETNACRKFHLDALSARLICTYRGTGTQYGISADGNDPEHIQTVGTGSALILRGSQWPEAPVSGLLHRSPPIEGTGETRLLLVLDPVGDPSSDTQGYVH